MLEPTVDETHDPHRRSWVADANGHPEFPIQNLPFGIFAPPGGEPQAGIAIGDHIVALRALAAAQMLDGQALKAARAACSSTLNELLALRSAPRIALRHAVSTLLAEGALPRPELLHASSHCTLHLPTHIGNFTDFYAGITHAENAGKLLRPANPLLPNYKWVPVGYHARASSIRASGVPVRRPSGQRKLADEAAPTFGPTRALDFELELGIVIGRGNELGNPIPIREAADHIAGYTLLNDWSARDLQAWEAQPLGPFLAKSFHTTLSPWLITPEALAPFRQPQMPRAELDPEPLPYLADHHDQNGGALNLMLEVTLSSEAMRAAHLPPHRLTLSHARHLFWTPAQLVAHHTSNGCNLQPGDLLGTGTISAPGPGGAGSLLELTRNGADTITLPTGEQRHYLLDGDEIRLTAHAHRKGFVPIGFGECRATVLPAR